MATDSKSQHRYFRVGKDETGSIDSIISVGQMNYEKGSIYPLDIFSQDRLFLEQGGRSLKYYQLVYITGGRGWFKNCNVRHEVHSGCCFIIRPGVWHSYAPYSETGWNSYFVEFTGHLLSGLIENLIPGIGNDYMDIGNDKEIIDVYETILKCASDEEMASQLSLRSYVSLLITLIADKIGYGKRKTLSERDRITQAISFMEQNLSGPIDIPSVANSYGFSSSGFRRVFKSMTGVAPICFLNNLRIQKAKHLLLTRDLFVKQVAAQCGFSSVEYFCSSFIKAVGRSPSDFRKIKRDM